MINLLESEDGHKFFSFSLLTLLIIKNYIVVCVCVNIFYKLTINGGGGEKESAE